MLPEKKWLCEGRVTFHTGGAFFRSGSQLTRDLGVLAAAVYRRQQGTLTVLDAMTGCGVRSLRYVLEARADFVWVNDGNCDLEPLLRLNLQRSLSPSQYRLSFLSTQKLLTQLIQENQRMDWIDLDNFGSPGFALPLAIAATKIGGFLYLTATDGKSLSGHNGQGALRQFYAYTRHHPAVHEQGLRVLIGLARRQARQQGLDILPIFSFFCGQTYRVLVKLLPRFSSSDSEEGFLGYCHHCGQFRTVDWRSLNSARCQQHDWVRPLLLSGPLWLGALHHSSFLFAMQKIALEWGWRKQADYLSLMTAEVGLPPYYFPLAEVGRRGSMNIPPRDQLIQAIRVQGNLAGRTPIVAQAFKTTAPFPDVLTIARQI